MLPGYPAPGWATTPVYPARITRAPRHIALNAPERPTPLRNLRRVDQAVLATGVKGARTRPGRPIPPLRSRTR